MGGTEVSTQEGPLRGPSGAAHRLVFVGVDARIVPLQIPSRLQIGRSEDADVHLQDTSISRLHAELACSEVGDQIHVELIDLGSANGTLVRGRRLEPGERCLIPPGELVEFGGVTMVLQTEVPAQRTRRIHVFEELEQRALEESERARLSGAHWSVVSVSLANPDAIGRVEAILSSVLRPFDIIAAEPGCGFLILLPEAPRAVAEALLGEIQRQAKERGLAAGSPGDPGLEVLVSLATCPLDGRSPRAVLEKVRLRSAGLQLEPKSTAPILAATEGPMVAVARWVERIAESLYPVLIAGETGSGKEVVAKAIHDRSDRRLGPWVKVSCAQLDDPERGSPNQSLSPEILLERARGGTLLLDEVIDLPTAGQARWLRILDQLYASSDKPSVRVMATTCADLELELKRGRLRSDFLHRIRALSIDVPPLRSRTMEIVALARYFAEQVAIREGFAAPRLGTRTQQLLCAYRWPGNVRELRSVIEQGVLLSSGNILLPEHLPMERLRARLLSSTAPTGPTQPEQPAELRAILDALQRHGGNQSRAAEMLGFSRGKLLARLDHYGVPRPKKTHRS